MSADNGVYILRSPVHPDMPGEWEYRVVEAMAIDNLDYKPDKEGFNLQAVKYYFGKCIVFHDRTKALLEADRLAQDCYDNLMVLEYGINTICMPFVFPE